MKFKFSNIWTDKVYFQTKRIGIFFGLKKTGNTYVNGVPLLKKSQLFNKYYFGISLLIIEIQIEISINQ